jgi:hypothetical protein
MANDRQDAVVFFVPLAHTRTNVKLFLHRINFFATAGNILEK